ncbi:hypothetical protein JOE63_001111 [Cellulosimicrobium cellulans]|uniref:hypothetical protein n=1 Tax=Cellulosimicrobium cellulans TaxID=1710 RepID=UPI0012FDBDC3|nr:hypothetical protein [Cellulosimicrobium cellulans]MBM7818634.1 hypothetical protein [Cellulosimicrobium cellulans]
MKQGAKRSVATGVTAVALTAGLALTGTAASAAGYYTLHAASDYSKATTTTNNGWDGRSYAQHGNRSALSAWYSASSYAWADSGTSSSYAAQVWFRY